MNWIGPRRAMLLVAIALIGIGWYWRDWLFTEPISGETNSVGAYFMIVGLASIVMTLMYSWWTKC